MIDRRTNRRSARWLIVLAIGLLLLELLPRLAGTTSPFVRLLLPIERGIFSFANSARQSLQQMVLGKDVAVYIAELESTITKLGIDRTRLQLAEVENKALQQLSAFVVSTGTKVISTRVIGFDPREPEGQRRLGAGTAHGVRKHAAVVSPEGVFVGKIVDTTEQASSFALLRRTDTQLPARVPGKQHAFGLLTSSDGLSLGFSQVPKEAKLMVGDVVVTNNGIIGVPSQLPIGIIESLRQSADGLWQEATIRPLVVTETLDHVAIIVTLDAE